MKTNSIPKNVKDLTIEAIQTLINNYDKRRKTDITQLNQLIKQKQEQEQQRLVTVEEYL